MSDPEATADLIGTHNILWVTLDTLRLDAAVAEYEAGNTPAIAKLFPSGWEHRHSPASFTYAAHAAFFAGFLPTPVAPGVHQRRFAMAFPGSETTATSTAVFDTPDIVTGLADAGYRTLCLGGVGFFSMRTPLGSVLPDLFQQAFWNPGFGVTEPDCFSNQVDKTEQLMAAPADQPTFLFINVAALHQPNLHYLPGAGEDSLATHRAALRHVDGDVPRLVDAMTRDRPCLMIFMSDHGTAYGEDGHTGHRIGHRVVWDVPYAEAVIEVGAWT